MPPTCTRAGLTLAMLLLACATGRLATDLPGFVPSGSFGERTRTIALDSGVTATIVAPAHLDLEKRVDLILYALPNGNSTAETIGRTLANGVGWRYDIQHIGAQTRALRTRGIEQAVVVYLEADTRSWPAWRSRLGYDRANARIVAMVDALRAAIGDPSQLVVTLTGHSGGGSFMFGFIEGQETLPSWLERIAFLDANYNFDARHGPKLGSWLHHNPASSLVVLAYDDREIMLDGKKVVSDAGGTWRASQRMLDYLNGSFALTTDTLGEFLRYRGAQLEVLLHPNPANRILHTEMIGEMNGYMHALLVRRQEYKAGDSVLKPARVYEPWIESPTTPIP